MMRKLEFSQQAKTVLKALAASDREVQLPVDVPLANGHLHIERQLRLLPGRRLTAWARLDGRPVITKLFFNHAKALREAATEAAQLSAMQDNTIAAPRLLADSGETAAGRCLLIEALEGHDVQTLYLESRQAVNGGHTSTALIQQLVTFIGKLHHKGCLQQDAHLGNFLMDGDDCWLLDAGGVSLQATLKPRQRYQNLALVLAQFYPLDLPDTATILSHYTADDAATSLNAAALERALEKARRTRYRHAIDKIYRDCTEFAHIQAQAGLKGMAARSHKDALQALLEADIDAVMAHGEPLKQGNSSSVSRVNWQGNDWVIKRYNIKGPLHRLKKQFKTSRASTSWRNARWLGLIGLDTPAAIGFVEQRRHRLLGRAYYISQHTQALAVERLEGADLQQAQTAMTAIFGLMERLRFNHGDMKASNILWSSGRISFIDLDAMQLNLSPSQAHQLIQKDRKRWQQNWR